MLYYIWHLFSPKISSVTENPPFYVCRYKNTVRTYVNTPATAKLAIAE